MLVLTSISILLISLILLHLIAEIALEKLNNRHVISHISEVPYEYRSTIDNDTYKKSIKYTMAKSIFGQVESIVKSLGIICVILLGIIPLLYEDFVKIFGISEFGLAVTFFAIEFIFSVCHLPFSWWHQFKLEDNFGFNRSSPSIFFGDFVKNTILEFIFLIPLLCIFFKLYNITPNSWWLWCSLVSVSFQAFMIIIYPIFILPRFNKLTPLQEGSLKAKIFELARKAEFPIQHIYTMDGSKRSSHSNAFFTGLGNFRHIVLYDTLLQQLSEEEIVAVIAHEMGHYKKQHIKKQLFLQSVLVFFTFWIVFSLDHISTFLPALGLHSDHSIVVLMLFCSLVSSTLSFWISPIFCKLSRRYEYEADKFSHEMIGNSQPLISSLRKLHTKNLSNLVPHPFYSKFYYSHPTLREREQQLLSYDL